MLQNELKGASRKIVMVAFDLLYLNGSVLRKLPLIEANMKNLISKTDIQILRELRDRWPRQYEHAARSG